MKVTFHESGKVADVKISQESLCSYFDHDAVKAAFKIKFKPAMKSGQPVTVVKTIEYDWQVY